MRFKLSLDGGDAATAAAEVARMAGCEGFEPAMLQVRRGRVGHYGGWSTHYVIIDSC
jgi:hypothetical protein